jgi:hypothetical protein
MIEWIVSVEGKGFREIKEGTLIANRNRFRGQGEEWK